MKSTKLIASLLLVSNLLCNASPVLANLNSLTKEELQTYLKALEQAKFYKYYEAMVKGQDRLTKITFEKTGEKDGKWVYKVVLRLRVADMDFDREFTEEVEKEAKTGFWGDFMETAGKIGLGILIGLVAGMAATSR